MVEAEAHLDTGLGLSLVNMIVGAAHPSVMMIGLRVGPDFGGRIPLGVVPCVVVSHVGGPR